METIKLWARHGDAVRQGLEWGDLVHLDTSSEALTAAFLRCALHSGRRSKWAETCPDPRHAPEIAMAGRVAAHLAARFAGLYARRTAGDVRRSASVLGA